MENATPSGVKFPPRVEISRRAGITGLVYGDVHLVSFCMFFNIMVQNIVHLGY